MRATIEQIAHEAGVSPGTVSRILNGKNKENRPAIARRAESVRLIASRLGYRPNAAARSMLRGRFGAAAFVTCGDLGLDWFPREALRGMHQGLEAHSTRLVIHELPAATLHDRSRVPLLFRETAVDGLIVNLVPTFSHEDLIPYFEAGPLPCVWHNLKLDTRAVYPDDLQGGRFATRWLLARGHRRIGFFARPMRRDPHYSVPDRMLGFRQAMNEAGLPADRSLPMVRSGDSHCGLIEAARYLDAFTDCDAVICYEHAEAVALHAVALQRGMRIPEDVELLAFGVAEMHSSIGLYIPTAVIPFREVGTAASDMLIRRIESGRGREPARAIPYEHVLI